MVYCRWLISAERKNIKSLDEKEWIKEFLERKKMFNLIIEKGKELITKAEIGIISCCSLMGYIEFNSNQEVNNYKYNIRIAKTKDSEEHIHLTYNSNQNVDGICSLVTTDVQPTTSQLNINNNMVLY